MASESLHVVWFNLEGSHAVMNEDELISILRSHRVELAGSASRAGGDDEVFYLPIKIFRTSDGKQEPSNGSLKRLAERLNSEGVSVRFLLRYPESDRIEEGLRATILHSHIDLVRNVFYSYSSGGGVLWVEPKTAPTQQQINEIAERARSFASLFGLSELSVELTSQQVLPGKLAILSTLRLIAPESIEKLSPTLADRGLVVPSLDWLRRQLDAYRKSKDVVRLSDGRYALTAKALRALGTVKGKASPDVARLLALARGAG